MFRKDQTKKCPRCGLPPEGEFECHYCGVNINQYRHEQLHRPGEFQNKGIANQVKRGISSLARIVIGVIVGFLILIFIFPYLVNFHKNTSPGPKKVSKISYFQIIDSIKKQKRGGNLTEAQLDAISKRYVGKRVKWTGWVFQVGKILSDYMIWVDMDNPGSGFSIQDVYLPIPQNKAVSFNKKQKISFEGDIKSIDKIFGKYTIELKNVKIK